MNSGDLTIMLEDANENNECYPVGCDGSPQPSCTSSDVFVADELWHHVAATRDASGDLALYIDGESVTTCQNTALPSSANQQVLTIGCTHGAIGPPPGGVEPPIWFFGGTIDDAAMWSEALSASEVDTVFAAGVDTGDASLVGYWDFEGTGQLAADGSGASNDGFLGLDETTESEDPIRVTVPEPRPNLAALSALGALVVLTSIARRTPRTSAPGRFRLWRRGASWLAFGLLLASSAGAQVPPVPVPDGNPVTEEKRVLGKILFWDEQLSSDDTVAVAPSSLRPRRCSKT